MSKIHELINALAFLPNTDENGVPVANETIDATALRDAQEEAQGLLDRAETAETALAELTDKVEELQKANQALKLENINLTDVATGKNDDDDILSGIVVE